MSEYQYYEFAAIDRPLTAEEMAQLRRVSTRGRISTTGFVNHYEWGGLKADPADWMRRYFDAFVYAADWGSCRLALRVPLATFRKAELNPFASGSALTTAASDEHWVIDWSLDESENYDRFAMEDGSGWMSRLAPLREELLRGDMRPLYLGWLASARTLDDDALEPEVPPGLAELRDLADGYALIARRGVNTLVLVHRTELLKQWQERLQAFLGAEQGAVGTIGGGKSKPSGRIDIAVMQSLHRQGETSELVEGYGQLIVDECHHVSAVSFEAILKRSRARYVLGLTATPIRRDGRQPIIFMQCGPTRHVATRPAGAPQTLEVIPRYLTAPVRLAGDAGIQDVFRTLAGSAARTAAIADEVACAYAQGHKVLVLTERTEHIEAVSVALAGRAPAMLALHGRLSKKQRSELVNQLDALPPDAPRVLLATGKLVGEGFDHPPLDTLVLAMPISWKGTLQQYAGRLHREHADKTHVRIIDFVDSGHPALLRMWSKRQRGYEAMGYRVPAAPVNGDLDFGAGPSDDVAAAMKGECADSNTPTG